MLSEAYNNAPSILTCEYCFRRYKKDDFETDKECPGQPKKFKNEEVKALLD